MLVKYFDRNGLKIIERKFDYKTTDGFNHLVHIDRVIKEDKNAPIPQVAFNARRNPRIGFSVPTHFRTPDDYPYG